MKKFYSILALLCVALVACESATDEATRIAKVDKETITLEKLIAEQNGEFDDEELLEMLFENSLVLDRMYTTNDKGEWEFHWEYDPDKNNYNSRTHYLFSENTFTLNWVYNESKIRRFDDIYTFQDYEYSYDAETNVLTTYCTFDGKSISVGKKHEAVVVYFDTNIVVLEGYIVGNDMSLGTMWRTVMKFDTNTRDNIICVDKYLEEPQDVDSEAIFAKMENYEMRIYKMVIYNDNSNQWHDSFVVGDFINGFRLKDDNIEFRTLQLMVEHDGLDQNRDVFWERPVVRDVENDALYSKFEVPEVGIQESTFKVIFDNGEYVMWRYDIVYNHFDKEPTEEHYILICTYN